MRPGAVPHAEKDFLRQAEDGNQTKPPRASKRVQRSLHDGSQRSAARYDAGLTASSCQSPVTFGTGPVSWFRCAVAVPDTCALYCPALCTELRESADTDEASSAQSSREPSAGAGERLAARADEAMRRRVPFVLGGTHAHCDTHTSLPLPACAIRTSFCGMRSTLTLLSSRLRTPAVRRRRATRSRLRCAISVHSLSLSHSHMCVRLSMVVCARKHAHAF